MRSRLARTADTDVFQLGLSMVITLALVLLSWHAGVLVVLFAMLLLGSILFPLASPESFARLVLTLAPLPSLGLLFGVSIPVGFDPLNVLVIIGGGVALVRSAPFPLARRPQLAAIVVVYFLLLCVAWFRTYGRDPITGASIALLIKPFIVFLSGMLVVQLLPRDKALRSTANAMAVMLLLVAGSVILNRLGLFRTGYQDTPTAQGSFKQFGGLMLESNAAGALLATFAVPTYVLLRSVGSRRLGVTLLLAVAPVLFVTLSRTSIIAYGATLIALALFDRRRVGGGRVVISIFAAGTAWALTGGRGQLDFILSRLNHFSGDDNAILSGRITVWHVATVFLREGNTWVFGGGLDSFQRYAAESVLHFPYATHNMVLRMLANGGIPMLATFCALLIGLWILGKQTDPHVGKALRIAIVAAIILGTIQEYDLFSRVVSWIWILVAFACVTPRPSRRHERSFQPSGQPPKAAAAHVSLRASPQN